MTEYKTLAMKEWAPKLTAENIAEEFKKMSECTDNLMPYMWPFYPPVSPLRPCLVIRPVMPAGLDLGLLIDGLNCALNQCRLGPDPNSDQRHKEHWLFSAWLKAQLKTAINLHPNTVN